MNKVKKKDYPYGTCKKKKCPIGGDHPPAGDEFLIGCGLCLMKQGKEITTVEETEEEMEARVKKYNKPKKNDLFGAKSKKNW